MKKKNQGGNKRRCQWASEAVPPKEQCRKTAARKYGDHWFCEEHGRREPKKEDHNNAKTIQILRDSPDFRIYGDPFKEGGPR